MLARAYEPRRPEETPLYDLVLEHLETFLQFTRESYAKPLPAYVEQEFRNYLDCGIFSNLLCTRLTSPSSPPSVPPEAPEAASDRSRAT